MATKEAAQAPSRVERVRQALASATRATLACAQKGRHDGAQAVGGLMALGGIYHGWGWTATLIIGGVSVIAASMLREGGRV